MLREEITYEDFNGDQVTDVFYFNLTQSELLDMEVSATGGLDAMVNRIVEARDAKSLLEVFKELVLKAYGVKSEDGKRFIKNDELRKEFVQSAAYDKLFVELATDDRKAIAWLSGVLPKGMAGDIEKAEKEFRAKNQSTSVPPVPPTN